MKKTLLAIILFFSIAPVFAADFGAYDMKRMNDEFKRDQQEMKKTRQAMEQVEQEQKQVDETIKRQRDETKQLQRQMEEEERQARLKRQMEEGRRPNRLIEVVGSWPMQIVFYFLIFIGFGAAIYFKVLAPRKKPAEEEPTIEDMGADVLAAVTHWRFREKDLERYRMRLASSAAGKAFGPNYPELKKCLIRDLVLTEILFQAAVSRKLDGDAVFLSDLSHYKAYASDLAKDDAALPRLLDAYKTSMAGPGGQRPAYASYYKDFLGLLMVLSGNDETELFELYERLLLINKLAGASDAAAAQHSF